MPIRVTVWNEHWQDKRDKKVCAVYPRGINGALASFLGAQEDMTVHAATLEEPECGLGGDVLDNTDVLLWWGHVLHDKVPDEMAAKVQQAVLKGMGFIALHSAHFCKPFRMLMGTSCTLRWRDDDRERLWCVSPAHPIAAGLPPYIELPHEEMYGEFFDVPKPDETVLLGWFQGGEVFRSGAAWHRGYGKVFYFQPGHEEYPTYYDPNIQKILINAVRWAAPSVRRDTLDCPNTASPEQH